MQTVPHFSRPGGRFFLDLGCRITGKRVLALIWGVESVNFRACGGLNGLFFLYNNTGRLVTLPVVTL